MATNEENINVLNEKLNVFKESISLHTTFTLREIAAELGLEEDSYVNKGKPDLLVALEGGSERLDSENEKREWLEKAIEISLAKEILDDEEEEDEEEVSEDEETVKQREELLKLQEQIETLRIKREQLEVRRKIKEEQKQKEQARWKGPTLEG